MDTAAVLADLDFPVWHDFIPGVAFRDVLPAVADPAIFAAITETIATWAATSNPDVIVGIDARGFLLGPSIAAALKTRFVPLRKAGKTPGPVVRQNITGEYATDTLELRNDLIPPGSRVIVHDDLIATGGSMVGAIDVLQRCGHTIVGVSCLVDLVYLGGSAKLPVTNLHYLRQYDH